jgi:hypothetical protein
MAKGVEPISFEEALKLANGGAKNLLLGNGFSIAQGGANFSYSSLLEKCGLTADHPIRNVFAVLQTVDFEEVMFALDHASTILHAYGDDARSAEFSEHSAELRNALIHAVREVHPGIQFDIPDDQRKNCANFLRQFDRVFTTNYDLLLYWVIVHELSTRFRDGFGLGDAQNGFRTFRPDAYCETFYLHGALHLFLSDRRDTQKVLLTDNTIIDAIAGIITNRKRLPLFVAEGTSSQKMGKINSVPYLRTCHDMLGRMDGNVFVFGLSAAERDRHIFDAAFGSKIEQMFYFVHEPTKGFAVTRENLAKYSANSNVEIFYVDTASAKVWH